LPFLYFWFYRIVKEKEQLARSLEGAGILKLAA